MKNKVLILADEAELKNFLTSRCDEEDIGYSSPKSVREANSLLSSSNFPVSLLSYSVISDADRNQIVSLFKLTKKSKFTLFNIRSDITRRRSAFL